MTRVALRLFAVLVLATIRASGEEPPVGSSPAGDEAGRARVLIFSSHASDPLVLRVAAEVESQGFVIVQVTPAPRTLDEAQMEAMARASNAVAAVRLTVSEAEIKVWIADLPRQRSFEHVIPVGEDATVASLRVGETLRSRLTDLLALAPAPVPPQLQRSRPPPPPTTPQSRHGTGIVAGIARSRGWPDFSWHAGATWRWPVDRAHGIEALVLLPVGSADVPAVPEGEARVTFGLLTAGWRWQPTKPSEVPIVPSFGVGPGAVLVRATGVAGQGQSAEQHSRLAFAPYVRLGLALAASRHVYVRGDLWAATTVPATRVLIDDDTIGTWGRVVGLGSVGLEICWP